MRHINDTTNDSQQKVTSFFPIRRSARKTKNIVNEEKQIALEKAIVSQKEDGLKVKIDKYTTLLKGLYGFIIKYFLIDSRILQ